MITKFNIFLNEAALMNKTIYYFLSGDIHNGEKVYALYLKGDTFDIKDKLKIIGFVWDGLNRAWKKFISKENTDSDAIPIFKQIEELGYVVSADNIRVSIYPKISGYKNVIFPPILKGVEGKNIIKIKDWHHYAPVTGVWGTGTFNIKGILTNIYSLEYDSVQRRFLGLILDADREYLTKYLQENNYIVEYVNEK